MKAIEIVNQIKDVLGIELSEEKVALATMKLENGTEIMAEEFLKDKEVFIIGEEGEKFALPVGDYTLEDSRILSVIEEGLIADIKNETEEVVEEEVEAEEVTPAAKVKSTTESTQVVYATKEEVSEVKLMIEEIKTLLEKKEDLKEEVKEVELTAEVVEPIAHNPEAITETKKASNNNTNSHLSRIREMIYN